MYNWFGLILLLIFLTISSTETRVLRSSVSDFDKHSVIVQPTVHHGRTKRELTSTRDVSGTHHSEIQLTVPVNGEQYFLDLQLNKHLLTREHTLQYQKNGQSEQKRTKLEELDLCYYTGSVRGKPDSLVAVSTCHGVNGIIHDGQMMRYIEPVRSPEIQSPHYLYNQKNFNASKIVLDHRYDGDNHVSVLNRRNYQKDVKESQAVRHKRDTSEQLNVPYNANNESRYVELVIAVDNAEFRANGGDLQTVHSKVLQISNIANTLLSQLNIFIALVGVVVWNDHDEVVIDKNCDTTLSNFKTYRSKLALEKPSDATFLLAKKDFDDGILGAAYGGKICTLKYSVGLGTTNLKEGNLFGIAVIIAHEVGHLLGMKHDSENCECPSACIMSGAINPVHWSECSSSSLAKFYRKGLDYCLRNKPTTLFNSPNCGNGFIDPGEQCDCGTEAGVGNINLCHACCHADTCTLRSNATCGAGACCDFTTCNLKRAGTVCHTPDSECYLRDFCTGFSEFCPADEYRMYSSPCGESYEEYEYELDD